MAFGHVTRREAADLLCVDVTTIDRWRAGDAVTRPEGVFLRSSKVGGRVLIERASVEALIDQGERIERRRRARRERVGQKGGGVDRTPRRTVHPDDATPSSSNRPTAATAAEGGTP